MCPIVCATSQLNNCNKSFAIHFQPPAVAYVHADYNGTERNKRARRHTNSLIWLIFSPVATVAVTLRLKHNKHYK